MVFLVVLLAAAACVSPGRSTTTRITSPPPTTGFEAPSYEALVKGEYINPSIPRITAEDLELRIDRGDKIFLIDTRTASKYSLGHLRGAINITDAVDSPFPDAEAAMEAELAAVPDDVLKVLYCD